MKFTPSPFRNSLSKMTPTSPYITDGSATPVVHKKSEPSKFEEFTPKSTPVATTQEEVATPVKKLTTKK
jgi:hypothetical protein